MEKAHLADFLIKSTPLFLAAFVLALVGKRKKEDFHGGLGDNFPYLSGYSAFSGKGLYGKCSLKPRTAKAAFSFLTGDK